MQGHLEVRAASTAQTVEPTVVTILILILVLNRDQEARHGTDVSKPRRSEASHVMSITYVS